jgi:uncharacterized protein YkwD
MLVLASGSAGLPAPRTEDLHDLERAAVRLVNAHRTGHGLAALATDTVLARLARGHSRDMADRRVPFGHDGFSARAKETERYLDFGEIAENVAFNDYDRARTVRVAVNGWLTSPHHLENIEGKFNLTGVGIVQSANGTYFYTQIFVARRSRDRRP